MPEFTNKYTKKFPHLGAIYSTTPDSIVVRAEPLKISLYKLLEGKPCTDVLDVQNHEACRMQLQ